MMMEMRFIVEPFAIADVVAHDFKCDSGRLDIDGREVVQKRHSPWSWILTLNLNPLFRRVCRRSQAI